MLGYYKNEQVTARCRSKAGGSDRDLGYRRRGRVPAHRGTDEERDHLQTGENVYPEELEDLLKRSPFILECMVYGEADKKHGRDHRRASGARRRSVHRALRRPKKSRSPTDLMQKIMGDEIAKVNGQVARSSRSASSICGIGSLKRRRRRR